jgi:hypothetical protein
MISIIVYHKLSSCLTFRGDYFKSKTNLNVNLILQRKIFIMLFEKTIQYDWQKCSIMWFIQVYRLLRWWSKMFFGEKARKMYYIWDFTLFNGTKTYKVLKNDEPIHLSLVFTYIKFYCIQPEWRAKKFRKTFFSVSMSFWTQFFFLLDICIYTCVWSASWVCEQWSWFLWSNILTKKERVLFFN